MTLDEERLRRERALMDFEDLVGLLRKFIHGKSDEIVPTQNGPIKTLAALASFADEHEAEVTVLLTDLTTAMDALAPLPVEPARPAV